MDTPLTNFEGMARDEFMARIPDDPYDPCPCGCGTKWRYVMKDPALFEKHEQMFVEKWLLTFKAGREVR
jgi:hypothetical protein